MASPLVQLINKMSENKTKFMGKSLTHELHLKMGPCIPDEKDVCTRGVQSAHINVDDETFVALDLVY